MSQESQPTILLVEDEPLVLHILIEYLKRLDVVPVVAHNGEEALRQVQNVTPVLILMDIMMPGMNGFETCRSLKSKPSTKDIPVIFMTSLSDGESRAKAFEAGGVDYITKPVDFKEVMARVQTRLTIRKLQSRLQKRGESFLSWDLKEKKQQGASGPTILVVDDNPMTCLALGKYLEASGFSVLQGHSGQEALELTKRHQPDLILLDVMMPGMDGFETCKHFKASIATRDIPVIFLTALTDIEDKAKAFEAGGTDYITKPHHYTELSNRITMHLTLRTLQKHMRQNKDFF